MTKSQFIELCLEMRLRQKFYFAHHYKDDLIASKRLESKFDKALEEITQYGFDD